jgi:peptidyl-dipeptidase A
MLHEFGHAVYDRYLDPALPRFLRGPAHTLTTEAVAMLNERFLRQADFLEGIAGMDPDSARRAEADSRSHKRDSMLVFLRWVLVMARFERALYESPEQDLCALWWDMVARHQWLDGSSRRAHPDWASKLHLAGAPVYYQNYLLGEMTASQLLAALRRETDGSIIGNPKVGQFFRERVFAPGAGLPWNARLREATGEELNPRYYIEDLRVREASPS